MDAIASANIAFSVAGLFMLAVVFWQAMVGGQTRKQVVFLVGAAFLHAGALACWIGADIPKLYGAIGVPPLLAWLAFGLDACSALMLAACILTDSDGRLRLRDRLEPLSAPMVAWAVGPSAVAGAITPMAGGIALVGFAYAVSLCLVYMLIQRAYEREIARREAELESGRAKLMAEQMRPHFVFNSLTSISSLCYTDPDAAAQAVADLSGYLRGNINALSSDEPIPFDVELSHIQQYVSLEQADPARAFSMEYDLKAKAFLIPPLTVQPLVENAVKHGALTHRDGSGKVHLSTEDRGQFVRVVVEDNGMGQASEKAPAHKGVGLSNVEKRLASFGGSLQVDIGDGGARTCVLVPRKER